MNPEHHECCENYRIPQLNQTFPLAHSTPHSVTHRSLPPTTMAGEASEEAGSSVAALSALRLLRRHVQVDKTDDAEEDEEVTQLEERWAELVTKRKKKVVVYEDSLPVITEPAPRLPASEDDVSANAATRHQPEPTGGSTQPGDAPACHLSVPPLPSTADRTEERGVQSTTTVSVSETAQILVDLLRQVLLAAPATPAPSQPAVQSPEKLTQYDLKILELSLPHFSGGVTEDPTEFLRLCEDKFRALKVPADSWINFATGHLRENAKKWWTQRTSCTHTSWQDFKIKLLAEFNDDHLLTELRAGLYGERQTTGSVIEFIENKLELYRRLHKGEDEAKFYGHLIELVRVELRPCLRHRNFDSREALIRAARQAEKDAAELEQKHAQTASSSAAKKKEEVGNPQNANKPDSTRWGKKNTDSTPPQAPGDKTDFKREPGTNWREEQRSPRAGPVPPQSAAPAGAQRNPSGAGGGSRAVVRGPRTRAGRTQVTAPQPPLTLPA